MTYLLRRLAFYLVAAWVAITLNFFIPRAVPGNPAEIILSKYPDLTPQAYKALEQMIGGAVGTGSLWSQYLHYWNNVFHFNFGVDLAEYPTPVSQILDQTIPWTLILVGTATVIAFLVGTGLGILAGWRHGGWLDRSLPVWMFFQAAPYFFIALVLVDFFAIEHHWLPVLPAFTIVLTSVAGWMLQMRNVMITTISEDYVIAAQAKGLSKRRVIFTYSARNALLPKRQGFGLALGFVVSGALIMEIVFSYPGIGLLLLGAVSSNDYPLM